VVISDRFVVGILIEMPDSEGRSALLRAERVVDAMELLRRAGFVLVLLPWGTEVRLKSRRHWWRRERRQ
jgi:hypothetical protein